MLVYMLMFNIRITRYDAGRISIRYLNILNS